MIDNASLAAQADPFTVCNKAIFDALLVGEPLKTWVRPQSRVSTVPRTDGAGFADSPAAAVPLDPAHSPALLVTQGGFLLLAQGRNSRTFDGQQTYTIQFATDVLDVVPLNLVKWEVWKALVRAGDTFGLSFVRGWASSQAQEGVNPQAAGGTPGWVGIMNVTVDLSFGRDTL
jgi:hypothetical protein